MASLINVPDCGGANSTFNSGVPLCDVIRDIPYGLIFLDSGVAFDGSDVASATAFIAALKTASRAARGSRVYPIWDLKNFEDKSKEASKGTLGNLSNAEIQLIDGIPSFSFAHRKGELFHSQLVSAETAGLKLMIVDKKYCVYGTKTSDGKLTGFTLAEFKAQLPKFQTPSAASTYPFDVTLDSITEYKENLGFFQANSSITTVTGLINVVVSEFSFATNVLKVKLIAAGGKNIVPLYNTELTQATAWVITNASSGLAVTVTPAYDSANEAMALSLSGVPFTGASSGDDFYVNLAAPSVLAANPINLDGFESTGAITVQKP